MVATVMSASRENSNLVTGRKRPHCALYPKILHREIWLYPPIVPHKTDDGLIKVMNGLKLIEFEINTWLN